ncbi:hypothetical protein EOPP23_13635 [Endozoicomonas sp. OPT23]|uniref:lipase family protein n=1 Tax=Endozoicomonas sp. OPT23 TaxID=2072845 RepID=UPI00129A2AE2|nr:lipase family protein [Endozoicomonas sp. OPT23]MRI34033.1 hypothetical protein [Endozoicomonas sp. OPT23]
MMDSGVLDTSAGGFCRAHALLMARLSDLAYANEDLISEELKNSGYKTCDRFFFEDTQTHTQGYIASTDDHLVIAFRGTEELLDDWLSNLKIGFLPWQSGDGKAQVHEGFLVALDSVWQQLMELIECHRTSNQSVWITGHSLGGALAVLTAARLSDENPELTIAATYTFAQPRVGNKAFAQKLKPVVSNAIYRVVNEGDMVAELPPRRMGYRHIGHLERITDAGEILEDYQPCWFARLWHRLKEYAPLVRLLESAMNDMEEHRLDSYIAVLDRDS